MIPTPEEAAPDWLKQCRSKYFLDWEAELAALIRERDRAILDEAERDCWNLAALRKKVLGE